MFTPDFFKGFAAGIVCTLVVMAMIAIAFGLLKPWLRLKMLGGQGTLLRVLAMRMRGTPAMTIVEAYTTLLHSGEKVSLAIVESQYVANRSNISSPNDLVQQVRTHLAEQPDDSTASSNRKSKRKKNR